ncbi:alpha-galactosidase [Oryzobacter telluris]|uniref:alpha-galactosidase n=1 Tax=Oryzobacter telluris TaxID=3149179 RepID=UPI00370DB47F
MTAVAAGAGPLVVALSTEDVTLVVDLGGRALPSVLHWGERLEGLDADVLVAMAGTGEWMNGPNDIDVPRRVAVLPEHSRAWVGRPGLSGSRDGRAWSTRFVVSAVRLDGVPVGGSLAAGPGRLEVEAHDTGAGLRLDLELALDRTGLVRARATVTNLEDAAYTVDGVVLALPVPAGLDEVLDFGGRWGRERTPQRSALRTGSHTRENRKGRTGADSAFVLHVGTPGFGFDRGRVRAVHTAWSGNHVHYAERVFTGERVIGGGELLQSAEVRLGRGESYASPWVFFSTGSGLDEVARQFHRHLRARPRPVSSDRPVTLNVWEAVYFDHRLDRLLALAERAARVGVERYVLDDGWFGSRRDDSSGLGDWVVSPDVWPEGLHPLVDAVHGLGMQFGLWFEPEMVNPDSDVARAHPDWMMAARDDLPVSSRHQQVMDLGNPEAYAHVRDQILAVLDEYDIDYLKWDHNRDLIEAGSPADGGRAGVHAQTLAVYRMLDELRRAHPALEIESCSSGGARVDLGVLERTDRVWVSDVIDPLERQQMMRWTTQLVPPEYLGSHIASEVSHSTGRQHRLSFRAGTAVFGHLGLEWDLTAVDEDTLDEIAEWIAFHRRHRGLLLGGDLVRVETGDDHVLVHGVVAADRSEAVFAVAVVGNPVHSPGPLLRFRGLDPATPYRVRPVVVGTPPAGLVAPPWWGEDSTVYSAPGPRDTQRDPHRTVRRGASYPGAVLTGSVLARVGTAPPVVDPDSVVLFHVEALLG